ncbi:hypothetical protein V8C40DRAFT_231510 [Trichoderma camerunense]
MIRYIWARVAILLLVEFIVSPGPLINTVAKLSRKRLIRAIRDRINLDSKTGSSIPNKTAKIQSNYTFESLMQMRILIPTFPCPVASVWSLKRATVVIRRADPQACDVTY